VVGKVNDSVWREGEGQMGADREEYNQQKIVNFFFFFWQHWSLNSHLLGRCSYHLSHPASPASEFLRGRSHVTFQTDGEACSMVKDRGGEAAGGDGGLWSRKRGCILSVLRQSSLTYLSF
jgi:hypothetical protein